jgi:hypothetical protein
VKQAFFSWLLMASLLILGCDRPPEATSSVAAPEPDNAIVASKAKAGVAKQGQLLQKHTDTQKIISGPANALLQFKQTAVFDLQVAPALKLFQASEGRFPKSHEEFMEKIIKANSLQLPELPEGAVYRFNTEVGELWVYPENEAP